MKAIVYHKYGSPDVLRMKHELLPRLHHRLGSVSGDEVFGDITACGFGAFAEYVCVPENVLALKPTNVSFEEAAAVPLAGGTALQGLRDKGQIQPGQKVLIYGASGGIGTFAVQITKYFGAEVTVVCSTKNLDMVRSIGADHVIDYTKKDFTQNEQHYDLIVATAGYRSIFDYKRALSSRGIYVATGGNRRYTLSEVPEALRYYGEGHARGKVVITVKQNKNKRDQNES